MIKSILYKQVFHLGTISKLFLTTDILLNLLNSDFLINMLKSENVYLKELCNKECYVMNKFALMS